MPYAKIDNAGASGQTAIVAAQAGMMIRVLSFTIVGAGAVTFKWQSASTDLSGAMSLTSGVAVVAPPAMMVSGRAAYLETAVGEALNLNAGGAVQVSGFLEYEYRRV